MENKTREIYKDNFTEYLLCLALDVGEGMLKNGGEIARVEDTIERICRVYGAVHVEVFTIISMINAAIRMPDGSYSMQLRRVRQTNNNINMLERLNALSRKICAEKPSLDDFDEMLREVKREKAYHAWVHILSSAVATGAFCLFFGGTVADAAVAFVIGFIISHVLNYRSAKLNSMARTVVSSFLAVTLAGISYIVFPSIDLDSVITGSIMLLVPGILFGTAMKDLLCRDLIAGTLKILQALIQTLMIGFGYMISYAILGQRLIPDAVIGDRNPLIVELVTALIASIAFSIMFRINRRHLVNAGICGLLSYASYLGVLALGGSLFWASFSCGIVTALYAEVNARIFKAPVIVMLIPGAVPIVPGGYLYRAVRDYICGMPSSAAGELTSAGVIALGMAGGIVTLTLMFMMLRDLIAKRKRKPQSSIKTRKGEKLKYDR